MCSLFPADVIHHTEKEEKADLVGKFGDLMIWWGVQLTELETRL